MAQQTTESQDSQPLPPPPPFLGLPRQTSQLSKGGGGAGLWGRLERGRVFVAEPRTWIVPLFALTDRNVPSPPTPPRCFEATDLCQEGGVPDGAHHFSPFGVHLGHVHPHTLPGVAVDREAALVHVKEHPAVFVLLLGAPAGGEAHGPRVAAPGPGAFGAFGVGAAASVSRRAGHGGAGAGRAGRAGVARRRRRRRGACARGRARGSVPRGGRLLHASRRLWTRQGGAAAGAPLTGRACNQRRHSAHRGKWTPRDPVPDGGGASDCPRVTPSPPLPPR